MKYINVILLLIIQIPFISCDDALDQHARMADPEYRKVHDDTFVYEESIEKAFPVLSEYYTFTEEEKTIIGSWNTSLEVRIKKYRQYIVPEWVRDKDIIIHSGGTEDAPIQVTSYNQHREKRRTNPTGAHSGRRDSGAKKNAHT